MAENRRHDVDERGDPIVDPADGTRKASVDLIGGSLARANAPASIQTFADEVIGDVTVAHGASNDEPLRMTMTRPQKRLHDVYEEDKAVLDARLETAVTTIASGGRPTAAQLRALSLPGSPMSGGVLEALADLRQVDAFAYNAYRSKLAGNLALVQLNWKVSELQDRLDEGMLTNPELGDAERAVIVQRQERLGREMRRMVQEKELAEKHVLPVMESVLMDHRATEQAAAVTALDALPDNSVVENRFGTQNPIGYSY